MRVGVLPFTSAKEVPKVCPGSLTRGLVLVQSSSLTVRRQSPLPLFKREKARPINRRLGRYVPSEQRQRSQECINAHSSQPPASSIISIVRKGFRFAIVTLSYQQCVSTFLDVFSIRNPPPKALTLSYARPVMAPPSYVCFHGALGVLLAVALLLTGNLPGSSSSVVMGVEELETGPGPWQVFGPWTFTP
jgi:hypothetical protein